MLRTGIHARVAVDVESIVSTRDDAVKRLTAAQLILDAFAEVERGVRVTVVRRDDGRDIRRQGRGGAVYGIIGTGQQRADIIHDEEGALAKIARVIVRDAGSQKAADGAAIDKIAEVGAGVVKDLNGEIAGAIACHARHENIGGYFGISEFVDGDVDLRFLAGQIALGKNRGRAKEEESAEAEGVFETAFHSRL